MSEDLLPPRTLKSIYIAYRLLSYASVVGNLLAWALVLQITGDSLLLLAGWAITQCLSWYWILRLRARHIRKAVIALRGKWGLDENGQNPGKLTTVIPQIGRDE